MLYDFENQFCLREHITMLMSIETWKNVSLRLILEHWLNNREYHYVDPDLRVEIFFEKEVQTKKGTLILQ